MKNKISIIIKGLLVVMVCIFSINLVIFLLDIGIGISNFLPSSFINLIVDSERSLKITEFLDLWISFFGISITAFLSYLLLGISKDNNKITERLTLLEEKRDRQFINTNVAIIFYQMLDSLNELQMLYLKYILDYRVQCCESIKIHSEWMEIIGNIHDKLSLKETELLYKFFSDIENINNATIYKKSLIENTFKKYVLPCYFDNRRFIDLTKIDVLTLLNRQMLSIVILLFVFLKQNTNKNELSNKNDGLLKLSDENYSLEVQMLNDKMNGEVSMTYNNLKIKALFENNYLTKGNVSGLYKDSDMQLHSIDYEAGNEFHAKFYTVGKDNSEENVVLDALYKDGKFKKGKLKAYINNDLWDGTVEYDGNWSMIDGVIKNKLVEDSQREYNYDAEQRWYEEQSELQNDDDYNAYPISSVINNEYRIYEDFKYEDRKIVERFNKRKEYIEED